MATESDGLPSADGSERTESAQSATSQRQPGGRPRSCGARSRARARPRRIRRRSLPLAEGSANSSTYRRCQRSRRDREFLRQLALPNRRSEPCAGREPWSSRRGLCSCSSRTRARTRAVGALVVRAARHVQERSLDQRGQLRSDVRQALFPRQTTAATADSSKSAGNPRVSAEQQPFAGFEEVVRPGNRGAKTALPLHSTSTTTGQQRKSIVQALEQRVHVEARTRAAASSIASGRPSR